MSSQPQNFELYDDLFAAVGTPTRDVLAWRSHRSHRRGWLVRRALLAADLIGLVTALLVTEALLSQMGGRARRISSPSTCSSLPRCRPG